MSEKSDSSRPTQGITTDCAHSSKFGLTSYRAVDLETGEILFSKDIGNQTNNIGEFLGVVDAVKYIMENDYSPKVIYTDSFTALAWFKNKKTASSKKYPGLKQAEVFLKAFAKDIKKIKVLYWNNRKWGEIPADYGNKSKKK